MANADSRRFVRFEGFLDESEIAELRQATQTAANGTAVIETMPFRDRSGDIHLMTRVHDLGHVILGDNFYQVARHMYSPDSVKAQNRARSLFSSLWGHVRYNHADSEESHSGCSCSLRGGLKVLMLSRHNNPEYRYLEPESVVNAFNDGSIEPLPLNPSGRVMRESQTKRLVESVSYDILPKYIHLLTT